MRVFNPKTREFEGTHGTDFWTRVLAAIVFDDAERARREWDAEKRDAALTPPVCDEGGTR
jgi:hypothetical protein